MKIEYNFTWKFFCAFLLTITLLLPSLKAEVSEKKEVYHGFSGGMFLHTGYISSKGFAMEHAVYNTTRYAKGAPFGIGGKIGFHLGEHWRLGSEGYSSTLKYGKEKSSFSLGWGGILVDYMHKFGRFTPFVGLTVGGGGATHTFLTEGNRNDFVPQEAVYRNYSFMILAPVVGLEYMLNSKLSVVLKADYSLVTAKEPDFAKGFRIYLGITFNRMK